MPVDERFRRQVALLVRTLPVVAEETCFALKGGTAINLFVRDLPRLSVDIDLTYLPVTSREASLADIGAALGRIVGGADAPRHGGGIQARARWYDRGARRAGRPCLSP